MIELTTQEKAQKMAYFYTRLASAHSWVEEVGGPPSDWDAEDDWAALYDLYMEKARAVRKDSV